ncbi:tRNA 2'-phosphotransferase 1 [Nowakowskiella sp. JEL0407]|nr:tRNA 2'-phosphotransferase 1 [Nowakowskiella sp. JEL0407]
MSRNRGHQKELDPLVRCSKTLSYILRHGAEKEGVNITTDGFVEVDELLRHPKLKDVSFEVIKEVVDTNDKKRFLMEEKEVDGRSVWMIRANQGHSLENVEVEMEEISDPSEIPIVIHGTYNKYWPSIVANGLSKISRKHIHFAVGKLGEDGVISGMRRTADVYIYIDAEKAMKDGIKFLRSHNNVILSSGIDGVIMPEYFLKVEGRNGRVINF